MKVRNKAFFGLLLLLVASTFLLSSAKKKEDLPSVKVTERPNIILIMAEELVGSHKPAVSFKGAKYSAFEAGTRVPTIGCIGREK